MTKSRGILPPRRPWPAAEVEQLRALYPGNLAVAVATLLGRPVKSIYTKARELGLQKSEAFKASQLSGRILKGRMDPRMVATQIQPGATPWNKGAKGSTGMHENCRRTQFKPGARPQTWLPVGSYRICMGNLEQKVNDLPGPNYVRWHPVHRTMWIEAYGPIPAGHICVFKPGQHTTELAEISLGRIEVITRAENARRNHPRTKDPELARLVQLKGAITRQVNRITREAREAKEGATQ